ITVKWKKATCTGYQIQYSTSSKFTSGTTKTVTVSKSSTVSKTISKLKSNKKYYVRIRAYKTVNGTKYYGTWSKAKSVTTKK
ncbi:MAG: fibronectin type III domain-containing protein, partial [Eubacterium sp.]